MASKHKGRTSRLGLLSNREKELIKIVEQRKKLSSERQRLLRKRPKDRSSKDKRRIKEITKLVNYSSKRFSTFTTELLKRLESSRGDLQIIIQSTALRDIRSKYSKYFRKSFVHGDYDEYPLTGFFDEIGIPESYEYDGTKPIPDYSTWKIFTVRTGNMTKYWLSQIEEQKTTVRDTTEPTYPIVGIKGATWRRIVDSKEFEGKQVNVYEQIDIRKILIEGLQIEQRFQTKIHNRKLPYVIPKSKSEAIGIENINIRIKSFKTKLQNSQRSVIIKN